MIGYKDSRNKMVYFNPAFVSLIKEIPGKSWVVYDVVHNMSILPADTDVEPLVRAVERCQLTKIVVMETALTPQIMAALDEEDEEEEDELAPLPVAKKRVRGSAKK